MSAIMPVPLHIQETLRIIGYTLVFSLVYYVVKTVYIAFFGPLRRFPGPFWNKLSPIPAARLEARGINNEMIPALHAKYGPVVRLAPNTLSFVGSHQVWNDIYGFRKAGQSKPHKESSFYRQMRLIPADDIFSADDASHGRQRKTLSHAFSDAALREQQPMLKEWAEKMKEKLAERSADGQKLDMLKAFNCTTFDIMSDLTFGEDLKMLEDGEYSPWVKTIFGGIRSSTILRAFRSFYPTKLVVDQLMKSKKVRENQWDHFNWSVERVDRRMARDVTKPDLWTRVIAKREADGGLSKTEQYLNASVFMIAGTETTATALSGLIYHLGMNPRVMQKITEEVRANVSSFEDMTLESLSRLKYTQACLQEALRMYPPVPIALPRSVGAGGQKIADYWVPEGTTVGVHQLSTYHSEEHFKNALEFVPERWLGTDSQYANDHRDALEPFSVGPRNCIGKNLAWHEMRLLTATVLLHFDVTLAEESKTWADQHVYTLWEKKPLMCQLTAAR